MSARKDNYMLAKQYLRQSYRLNEMINSHSKELESLRTLATKLPSTDFSQDKVQGGTQFDKISSIIAKIIDLETQINSEIDSLVGLKKKLHDAINDVDNPNERLVLRCRYIEFLTWEQISDRMAYSVKQVHRIHSDALKHIIIPKMTHNVPKCP